MSPGVRLLTLVAVGALAGCASRGPVLPIAVEGSSARQRVELTDVPFYPQEQYQCGPAALATVLAYSGLSVAPGSLVPEVYVPARRGSLQVEMVAAARRHGRIPYVLQPGLAALLMELEAGHPVVVLQNLGLPRVPVWHFAVAVGYSATDDTVVLRSGRDERREMSAYKFLRTWDLGGQWAMLVLRPGELPAAADADRYLRAVAATEQVAASDTLVAAYRAALSRWPEQPVALFGLANALRAEGELDAAIETYRLLARVQPGHIANLNNLADVLSLRGCRTEALATVEQALAAAQQGEPLRPVLEQTRREILTAGTDEAEPAACSRAPDSGGAPPAADPRTACTSDWCTLAFRSPATRPREGK
jgi:hypothetical protein